MFPQNVPGMRTEPRSMHEYVEAIKSQSILPSDLPGLLKSVREHAAALRKNTSGPARKDARLLVVYADEAEQLAAANSPNLPVAVFRLGFLFCRSMLLDFDADVREGQRGQARRIDAAAKKKQEAELRLQRLKETHSARYLNMANGARSHHDICSTIATESGEPVKKIEEALKDLNRRPRTQRRSKKKASGTKTKS